ncbi:hypothetical protein AAGS40_29580 (plasmid) [Paraburkholderia sp. PREW-6R]|uniref:hypothetical protein n=1 Tax=Paraburkholderia sp. PREW-6R TaxID=3141544 RepID=UPI0031F4823A
MNHAFVKPVGYEQPVAVVSAGENGSLAAIIAGTRADSSPQGNRLDVEGRTVGEVCSMLCKVLRNTELEPEWLVTANMLDDPNEATSGARMDRICPADSVWNRVAVSVDIGRSEGWIVHVDWITRTEIPDVAGRGYAVLPLLRAKVFVADQAWQLARFISHAIDRT